jgi:hypothetical protein
MTPKKTPARVLHSKGNAGVFFSKKQSGPQIYWTPEGVPVNNRE